jgi:hypothetical protein
MAESVSLSQELENLEREEAALDNWMELMKRH